MDLLINDTLCELKPVNTARRLFFTQNVLSFFPPEGTSLEDHQKAIKDNLKEQGKEVENFQEEFYKSFDDGIKGTIWHFLAIEDKKAIKRPEKLDIPQDQKTKFINWVNGKIEQYCEYVKLSVTDGGKKAHIDEIKAFIAKTYGWTFEKIEEMDELQFFKTLEQAILLKQQEHYENVNANALAAAFGSGSKPAKQALNKIGSDMRLARAMMKDKLDPKRDEVDFSDLDYIMAADKAYQTRRRAH
jgi:hypothetical protein